MPEIDCNNIPERLHLEDRQLDNDFSNLEDLLFRRFKTLLPKSAWIRNNELSASVFALKDDSYNWSKYSEAKDVLYNVDAKDNGQHFFNWGIVSIELGTIREVYTVSGKEYSYSPIHTPLQCMYPHVELRIMSGNERVENRPKSVKAYFRDLLIEKCSIVKVSTV